MHAPRPFRMMLLVAAAGLAACQAPLPRSVEVATGQPCEVTLQMKSGLALRLRNASAGRAEEVYRTGQDQSLKVVPDAEMQTLLDLFTAQKLFDLSLPQVPSDARDLVRLDLGGRTWVWARRGSFTDPREAAYQQVQGYFMTLYNGNQAWHSDDRAEFDSIKAETSRKSERAQQRLERGGGGQR